MFGLKIRKPKWLNLKALFAKKEANLNGDFVSAMQEGKKIAKIDFVAVAEIFPRNGLDLNTRVIVPKNNEGQLYTVVLDAEERWFCSKAIMGAKDVEVLFSEKDMMEMVANNQIIIRKFS